MMVRGLFLSFFIIAPLASANGGRKWPHSEEILAAFSPILGDLGLFQSPIQKKYWP
jgi:hypothetical protein